MEKEYFREWERTTALKEDYGRHEPTVWSTLAALPLILKYYGIPGPIRYLLFWLGQLLAVVARKIQRQLVLAGKLWRQGPPVANSQPTVCCCCYCCTCLVLLPLLLCCLELRPMGSWYCSKSAALFEEGCRRPLALTKPAACCCRVPFGGSAGTAGWRAAGTVSA